MGCVCFQAQKADAQTQCDLTGEGEALRRVECHRLSLDALRSMPSDTFRVTRSTAPSCMSYSERAELASPIFCQQCASKSQEKSIAWLSSRKVSEGSEE